ncbi:hypothetical protein [Melittangium boletus]|uniref:Uncharacterized protein n=1 Tax=Melittangium boletus DSM 14713 TaxID=1294270 RepID=A0A250I7P5_9BACT|nr:hypothetical protein [Melittangium boletus]ATB27191.1 hypothetical protein MEBOL_000629 [Melittangium boletus DSM 14713]
MSRSRRFVTFVAMSALGGVPLGAFAQAEENPDRFRVGGALRFSYFIKSWEGQEGTRQRWGDVAFDVFRVNADGRLSNLLLSAEYRFYAGYSMLHHGYIGYAFSENTQLQLGLHRAPFGLLPYASHNWFFGLPYYMGFEDDYDLGLKLVHEHGPWNLQFAFYKNDEGSYTGRSTASARYSYDVVPVSSANPTEAYLGVDQANSETNQLNARVAYRFTHGAESNTELGLSAQAGQLHNALTGRMGWRWAAAAHLEGNYGPWNVKLEALHYAFRPANPEGSDNGFVTMGAYDAPYKVASQGTLVAAGVSYGFPVTWGPISRISFHEDLSLLKKVKAGYADSYQNALGTLITAGPVYTYVDLVTGKNQPWLGANYGDALAEGSPNSRWETRFNVNVGYYF